MPRISKWRPGSPESGTLAPTVKQYVTLDIAGAKYRMSSDAEPAHLQRLADVINDRIQELGPRAARSASPAQLLAVVALGLAEDLEVAERRRVKLEARTREALTRAIARIDKRLASDAVHGSRGADADADAE